MHVLLVITGTSSVSFIQWLRVCGKIAELSLILPTYQKELCLVEMIKQALNFV